jgi:flavin-dependent dehydrogenase
MARSFDVVVVGARCAGASTALLLSRAGARVLMVDRGAYGTDTLSTHALMRGAVLQLQRWGILPAIVSAGTPPVRSTAFVYRSNRVDVPIETRFGVDALYAPRRALLDRLLVDAAIAAGTEVSYHTSVEDLQRDASGRVVGLRAKTASGVQDVEADLVVGADGVHSTIASRVGAATRVQGQHATCNLYSYWEGIGVVGYEWHFCSDVISVGVIPTNDGASCVFVSLPPARFKAEVRGNATAAYDRLLPTGSPALTARLEGARRVETVRGFAGIPGFIRQTTGPGWALVGDAAYFKDPLTAHGITDALRDAELLVRAASAGTEAAFAEYVARRDDLSHGLFEVTDKIASFGWTDSEVQLLHRALSKEMTREVRALTELEPMPCPSPWASAPHAV